MQKIFANSFSMLAFLLISTFYCLSLQGQIVDESAYIQFESTSVSVNPPLGFTLTSSKDRWEGENASIELEIIRGKSFTPRSDTMRTRPEAWRTMPSWEMDTIINGRRFEYYSATTSRMMGRPEYAVKLDKWEGLLRFGTKDVVYYLAARSSDISPKRIEELQNVVFSARFEGDLIAKAEVKNTIGKFPLFDLDLSDFPFGDQFGSNNVFSYRDIKPMVKILKMISQEGTESARSDHGSRMLELATEAATDDYLTVTQYGEGTGDNLIALKHAVIVDADRLKGPIEIRGRCELGARDTKKLGKHEALYSTYTCRGGNKAINGAIFAFTLGQNVFKIEYEVADWSVEDITRLEQRLGTFRLK